MNGFSNAVVRIVDTHKKFVGVGVLLNKLRVVTTAEVINEALKLTPWRGMPIGYVSGQPPFQDELFVDFPFANEQAPAVVRRYYPALPDRSGDLAQLELLRYPPRNIQPLCLKFSERLYRHRIQVVGFTANNAFALNGTLFGHDRCGWVQYHLETPRNFPAEGLRGTPVWDQDLKGVVGIIGELGFSPMGILQPIGLANGAPISHLAFPLSCNVKIENRDLFRAGFERVEMRMSDKAMRPHESHFDFIKRVMNELEDLLGKAAKGRLQVLNLLLGQLDGHYRLVVDLPVAAIQRLDELFRNQDADLVRMGILEIRALFEEVTSRSNIGPCAFADQIRKSASGAKGIDAQLDESLERLDRSLQQLKIEMEKAREYFLCATGKALRHWNRVTAERIARDEYHQTLVLADQVEQLKDELNRESGQVEMLVRNALKKEDLWWHLRPGNQRYKLFDFNGRLRGAGEIEVRIREVSERLRTILRRYGYSAEKYWNEHPFDWSPEMKDAFVQYEELREKAAEVYLEMNKLKDTQIKYSGKGKAGELWEN